MFLNEVALGKEHAITQDDGSLRKAPTGFHSVVARGQVEPGRQHRAPTPSPPSHPSQVLLEGAPE